MVHVKTKSVQGFLISLYGSFTFQLNPHIVEEVLNVDEKHFFNLILRHTLHLFLPQADEVYLDTPETAVKLCEDNTGYT